MKVSLERSIGIPTVPFAPLKITVSIEGDAESPSDIERLSEKLDSILALEIMKTLDESITITEVGYKNYLNGLKLQYNDIMSKLED